jgi:hypothetical protein
LKAAATSFRSFALTPAERARKPGQSQDVAGPPSQAGTFIARTAFPNYKSSRRIAMDTGIFGRRDGAYFGRPEDQPLIFAVLLVLIAVTLYVFV